MKKIKFNSEAILFPTPSVLVGSLIESVPNFMTAAWCGVASSKPAALSVGIRHGRHSLRGIINNSEFSINVPTVNMAKKVDFCGIFSGNKKDKSNLYDIFWGKLKAAPLVSECPVNIECKVIHRLNLGSHILIVGEIIQTHVNENCMTNGKPDSLKIDPLVYSPGTKVYQRLGEVVGNAFQLGRI